MGRLGKTEDVSGWERDARGVQEGLGLLGRGAEGCGALLLEGAADDGVVGESGLAEHVVRDVHGGGCGGRFGGGWGSHCSGGCAGGYRGLASTA
jgi:hypothetical protein